MNKNLIFELLFITLKIRELAFVDDDEDNLHVWGYSTPSYARYNNIKIPSKQAYYLLDLTETTVEKFFFNKETDMACKDFDDIFEIKTSQLLSHKSMSDGEIKKYQKILNITNKTKVWQEFFGGWNRSFLIETTKNTILAQFPGVSYIEDAFALVDNYSYAFFEKTDLAHYTRIKRLRNTTFHRIFEVEYFLNTEYQYFEFNLTNDIDKLSRLILKSDVKNLKYLRYLKNFKEAEPLPRKTISYSEYLFGSELSAKFDENDIAFFREQDNKIARLHKKLEKELSDPDRDADMFSSEFLFDIGKEYSFGNSSSDDE